MNNPKKNIIINTLLGLLIIVLVLFPPSIQNESDVIHFDKKRYNGKKSDVLLGSGKIEYRFLTYFGERISLKAYSDETSEEYVYMPTKIVWWLYLAPIIIILVILYFKNNDPKKKLISVSDKIIESATKKAKITYDNISQQQEYTNIRNDNNNKIKSNIIETNNDSSTSIINEILKVHKLKESGIYTEEEFISKIIDIVSNFTKKGKTNNLEDILFEILPLKKNGVLSLEDINRIKSSLFNENK